MKIMPITIYSKQGLQHSAWLEAFPDAQVTDSFISDTTPLPAAVFIWAGLDNWVELLKQNVALNLPVLIFSNKNNLDELNESIRYGAKGYLDFNSSETVLKKAAKAAIGKAFWLPDVFISEVIKIVDETLADETSDGLKGLETLTERETEIALAVRQGMSNKRIALDLKISESTVKKHLTRIFQKLGIKDRIQLALVGRE